MSDDLPPSGWYPAPGQQGLLRYWDGHEWTEHRIAPRTPREPFSAVGRAGAFVAMSIPLLLGFYIFGSVVMFAWGVIPLAAWIAPRIWPRLSRSAAALLATGVAAVVWLPAFAVEENLLIPLCGPGFVGTMVPAVLATVPYLVVGVLAAVRQKEMLWIAAGALVPVVYALVTAWLDAPVTC